MVFEKDAKESSALSHSKVLQSNKKEALFCAMTNQGAE